MEDFFTRIDEAFRTYRDELEKSLAKQKPTDGLFGIGHSIKDDVCHDRFDETIAQITEEMAKASPDSDEAKRVVYRLFCETKDGGYPLSAEWMLCAVERHILPLIPFLSMDAAAELYPLYAARFRPWERLPVQKQVCKALKERARR